MTLSKKNVIKTITICLVVIVIVMFVRSGFLNFIGIGNTSTSAIDEYSDYYLEQTNKEPKNSSIKVTFYGTTMFLLDDGQTKLLFDAFITRPSIGIAARSFFDRPLIETDRELLDTWLSRPEVGKPEAVFIAHSHHDHAMDVAYVAEKTGARVYGSESTLNIARGGDIPEDKLSRYNLGKELIFNDFSVTILPGRHALNPDPLPDDRGMLILEPLRQPAKLLDYVEGGAFDFLIKHGDHSILIKGHTYIPEVLDNIQADVLFLSVSPLAAEDLQSPDIFYDQTVGKVMPKLVIPAHWDQFFQPLNDHLVPLNEDDLRTSFDFLIKRLTDDGVQFGIMQGYQSIMLFGDDGYPA
ncbi:MAG: MBL fold metallo-hydrolase [Cyanobacteria bacterium P01_F01_bin.150]